MNDAQATQQANMDLVARVGSHIRTGFTDEDRDLFAQDVVFHFFNPRLPELAGDHHGLDGISAFFDRLREQSDTGFHNEPHSLTPFGDELVVAYATNTLSFGGAAIDVDAVVVWRVFDGRIHEVWDIPAINTVRPHA
ncbi:MAG: nuclear transport factor 2 family protein [Acidimicrobiia bacterium]|nr:nuclear transport factor 2 family protein [Acidimicrobiia bacterium]